MGSSKAVEKEIMELFEKAKKAADKAITDEAEEQHCLDALKALRAVPVTMGVLVSTQVWFLTIFLFLKLLFKIHVFRNDRKNPTSPSC